MRQRVQGAKLASKTGAPERWGSPVLEGLGSSRRYKKCLKWLGLDRGRRAGDALA